MIADFLNRCRQVVQMQKKLRRERRLSHQISKIIDDQGRVSDYLLREYINPYLLSVKESIQVLNTREKIVWQYWDTGLEKAPKIVKASMNSVSKNLPKGYQHILLSDESIREYVDLPEWVIQKHATNPSFRTPFFSDILRLFLLEKYGGVWVDATIFMSSEIPRSVLSSSFFVFYRGSEPPNSIIYEKFNPMYFSWRTGFKVRMCNSFIVSNKAHPFVSALKELLLRYWSRENEFMHYFIFQILFEELINAFPFCNVQWRHEDDLNIHKMLFEVKNIYNEIDWERLCNTCFVHKLTYYNDADVKSHYEHIKNLFC